LLFLRARLKRYVVERCLYGVDVDPLAVELGRLALWVETMDKELPFEFLDHKLKPGNALLGCWFDRFRDYPVMAWEREGGDKNHSNGVHFGKEEWTRAIKQFRNERIKAELPNWLSQQQSLLDRIDGHTPEVLHDEALDVFETMYTIPVHETEERAVYYRELILDNPALQRLKAAFDTWCAMWFWPADRLDDVPTPLTFERPSETTQALVSELAEAYRFFHWELEFPDVFTRPGSGFDAVVGNPPWEIQKPNSQEFFSNLDPLYRTYGKQEAVGRQTAIFRHAEDDERAWLMYNARFKALSNWTKHAAFPFGDALDGGERFSFSRSASANDQLHTEWRTRRAGRRCFADVAHAFRHQGSADINTYKLFLEQAHALLRDDGYLGLLAPSGLYTDKGTTALRTLYLQHCRWHWLFGFINWNKIFEPIYYRFKFCITIMQKGGATSAIRSAFSRYHIQEWEEAGQYFISYPRTQVERFSPKTRAILETRERRDLEVLEKIYANAVLLGDDSDEGWQIRYATEFHMTNDSKLFPPRPKWEAEGYQPDEYSRWLKGLWRLRDNSSPAPPDLPRWEIEPGVILSRDGAQWMHESEIEDVALPLYEGRMIGQFDFSQKGWVSGRGRGAVWREIPWDAKVIEPQYCMKLTEYIENRTDDHRAESLAKVGFMDVTSATNERTMIASVVTALPCGNSAPVLCAGVNSLGLTAVLNAFTYDYVSRARCGGVHLNYFVIDETPLIRPVHLHPATIRLAAQLGSATINFAPEWMRSRSETAIYDLYPEISWEHLWAITPHERLRLRCLLDAFIAELYGLDWGDLAWMLRNCDQPVSRLRDRAFYRTLDPKGFWRVDKDKDPELRHTVLTLAAFQDLKDTIAAHGGDRERGIVAFCNQNDGDGWMLPETLRLSDLGLGHDERARQPQPVGERLGPRFLPWQLAQSVEDSWAECALHARNLLGEMGFARLQREVHGEPAVVAETVPLAAEAAESYDTGVPGAQRRLFPGEPTLFGNVMEDPPPQSRRRR
jgi:hypothetical protein